RGQCELQDSGTAQAGKSRVIMQSMLRLSTLRIHNFRCFEQCVVDLHERLTVFVADNARGKSAILDAISLSLSRFVDELSGARQSDGILRSDVRLVRSEKSSMTAQLPTELVASGLVLDERLGWRVSRTTYDQKAASPAKEIKDLRRRIKVVKEAADNNGKEPL